MNGKSHVQVDVTGPARGTRTRFCSCRTPQNQFMEIIMGKKRNISLIYDTELSPDSYYLKRPAFRDARLSLLPKNVFESARVLDVGCNEGWVTCEIGMLYGIPL